MSARKTDVDAKAEADDLYDSGAQDIDDFQTSSGPLDDKKETYDSGVDVCLAETFDSLKVRAEDDTQSQSPSQSQWNIVEDDPWPIYFRQDNDGNTQLHIAILHGLTNAVLALLDVCPHPVFLDVRNDSGYAAIHLAVLTGQPQIVRRLLIAGAKVNTRDGNGNTAIHLASSIGDVPSLTALTSPLGPPPSRGQLLLQHAKARTLPQALDQKNYDGETCVHVAAKAGQIEVLRRLVWYGADINSMENKGGRTALHIAIEHGNVELLKYLVTECSSSCGIRNYSGYTALQLASAEFKKQLLAAGYKRQENESDVETDSDSEYDDDDDNEMNQFSNSANLLNSGLRTGEAINVA